MSQSLLGVLEEAKQLGFLGPGPVEHHLDHARAFSVAVPGAPATAVDLGAGGGLPGLVLATERWPDARWTFVDSQRRRTDFLQTAVRALGVEDRVAVVTERAEVVGRDPRHRGAADLVVARSFGSPPVLAECAAPLLRPGGHLVVSEPPDTTVDLRWPRDGLAALGLEAPVGFTSDGAVPSHFARMRCSVPCPERYPRRVGVPAKRPLF